MAGGGKGAVLYAFLGNGFITIIKTGAFLLSGSGAILSEAIHSFADTCNQGLLFLGIRRSRKPADAAYHYGYGAERFLFALLAAIGIFVLGCGVTVYHGVHNLLDPPDLELSWISFAVMGVSLIIESAVLVQAVREVWTKKGDRSFFHYLKHASDPTVLAVLFEDAVAVLGVIVATAGIVLAHVTGEGVFDAASSIIIGAMLGAVAIWLGLRNRELILGPAIPPHIQDEVVAFLEAQPSVERVRRVRTRIAAADRFHFAAEIDYDGRHLGRQQADWIAAEISQLDTEADRERFAAELGHRVMTALAKEIDRIEEELYERFPRLRHIELESDAGTMHPHPPGAH